MSASSLRRALSRRAAALAVFGVALATLDQGATAAEASLRVVTYGTSLTAGGGWQEEFRRQLTACLNRPVEVLNLAKSGEASDWGLEHIDGVVDAAPDIVTLEFSANDASLHRGVSFGESKDNIRVMVQRLRTRRADMRIVLMAMNPMHGLRGGWLRPRLDTFYDSYADLAQELGVEFLDHRPGWAALPEDVRDAGIPDGVHPTPALATAVIVRGLIHKLAPECPR